MIQVQNKTEKNTKTINTIISEDNVIELSSKIVITSLKTDYKKSGSDVVKALYNDAVAYSCNITNCIKASTIDGKSTEKTVKTEENAYLKASQQDNAEGRDLINTVVCVLADFYGKTLTDESGFFDKKGESITVLKYVYKYINKYIHNEKNISLKEQYIEVIDEDGNTDNIINYIKAPKYSGIEDYTTYTDINKIITSLNMTEKQKQFLKYRLQGLSFAEISTKMGFKSRGQAQQLQKAIQEKYKKIYGNVSLEGITSHKGTEEEYANNNIYDYMQE